MIALVAVQNKFADLIINTAKTCEIPYQIEVCGDSMNDTDAFAYSYKGTVSALLSLPLRYMHSTVEMTHQDDVVNTIRLMYEVLQKIEEGHNFKSTCINLLGIMEIAYFTFNPFQENTYVLYDSTGERPTIDPLLPSGRKRLSEFTAQHTVCAPCVWSIPIAILTTYLTDRTPSEIAVLEAATSYGKMVGLPVELSPPITPICAQRRYHTIWQNNLIGFIHARALARQHIALSRSIGHAHRRRCIVLSKHRTHRRQAAMMIHSCKALPNNCCPCAMM